jgi:bifunctional non-homologous end joining protein LigD
MLATPAEVVPSGDGWRHEVKWDGMRALIDIRDHQVRLYSRTERDVTVAFPELVAPAAGLTDFEDLLLDAEIVVMRDGRPSFAALAERFNVIDARTAGELAASAPVTAMVFDVLRVMGTPVTGRTWSERRDLLTGISPSSKWVMVPPTFPDGEALLAATADQGMEGIVSKRITSTYRPGARSDDWRKSVHRRTASYVVVGWRREQGGSGLGAVLLAEPTAAGLAYRGRVGSGLAGRRGVLLARDLLPLRRDDPPVVTGVPDVDAKDTVWVEPVLVADVEFHGLSDQGRLRQPSWRGVRADLTLADLLTTEPTTHPAGADDLEN